MHRDSVGRGFRLRVSLGTAAVCAAAMVAFPAPAPSESPCEPVSEDPGFCGDDGPATDARLASPYGIARLADGRILVADSANNRIRLISRDGRVVTVAGTGMPGSAGDGGPAVEAELTFPTGVAAARGGGFLIADSGNHRVRMVKANGTISTVAGSGEPGFGGDGGPATSARLFSPTSVSKTKGGGFLIADNGNRRIRLVSPDGVITTVAGTGSAGFSGEGGEAIEAELDSPTGVAAIGSGRSFLIADSGNNRVRQVAADGIITTVAGTGEAGFAGDDGLATDALLDRPTNVSPLDRGYLIADSGNQSIRKVSAAGEMVTVAGTGSAGFSGDGGPAVEAEFTAPTDVIGAGDGAFLVADTGSNRIRNVGANGTVVTVAGAGETSEDPEGLAARVQFPKRRLVCYFQPSGFRWPAGRPIRIVYVTTQSAHVSVRLTRDGSTVRTEGDTAAAGINKVRVESVGPGKYRAGLYVGGSRLCDRQVVKIVR